MRTSLVVVTGVDALTMQSVVLSLLCDLPRAVAVRHAIDPSTQTLTRTVSDATGAIDTAVLPLEHACVDCALHEDILPTLERLARDGRWTTIVACLPVAADAEHLSDALTVDPRLARHLRLSSVLVAAEANELAADLLGATLLRERNLHHGPDDDRGIGEVHCSLIEYADAIVLSASPDAQTLDLIRALAHPSTPVITGVENTDAASATQARHSHTLSMAWRIPVTAETLPPLSHGHAWRLDLSSPRPFHPQRLLEHVERLGTGAHRSRGCFWLPTRPGFTAQWAGAGGQLCIGPHSRSGHRPPLTRLIFTGLGDLPDGLVEAFEDLLITAAEEGGPQGTWHALEDGLEPWLGAVHQAA